MTINSINNQIPNNDFLVQKTGSGTTVTSTISQTSNTASATAKRLISVAGGTAGDAFTNYTVSGVTNWSEGVDNSDGDAYVIAASTALGTTNVARCSTAGEWNYPLQPAFSAKLTSQVDNVTGDGTVYSLVYGTEIFDQNSDYNHTTGVFTAPITGVYCFNTMNSITGLASNHNSASIDFKTTGGDAGNLENPYAIAANNSSVFTDAHSYTLITKLTAADTVFIQITVRSGSKVVDITADSYFQGYLIC